MKKLIIAICLTGALFAPVTGCKNTSPTTAIVKSEAIIVTSVDTGMKIWHDYVVAHLTDGKVTQKEIDTVATAYNAYYTAQLAVKATLEQVILTGSTNTVDIATANASVINAETSLLALINKFLNQ